MFKNVMNYAIINRNDLCDDTAGDRTPVACIKYHRFGLNPVNVSVLHFQYDACPSQRVRLTQCVCYRNCVVGYDTKSKSLNGGTILFYFDL
jgi:hypothetical protein